jgi:hypothetical protein
MAVEENTTEFGISILEAFSFCFIACNRLSLELKAELLKFTIVFNSFLFLLFAYCKLLIAY